MYLAILVSTLAILALYLPVIRNVRRFECLDPVEGTSWTGSTPKLSVIVPAFNESENIGDCIEAVVASTNLSSDEMEIVAVDDQSTDNTLEILENLEKRYGNAQLKVIRGKSRPRGETWTGKNWACWQGALAAKGEYLLFVDADVRLEKGCPETVLAKAVREGADLLSITPRMIFGCLSEFLIQPIIIINLLLTFDAAVVNRQGTKPYFAAGPFMLFKASAYKKIGGHREVAAEVLDDEMLAKNIKSSGCSLKIYNGKKLASLTMYNSWKSILEGWSKNLYVSLGKSMPKVIFVSLLSFIIFVLPWLNLLLSAGFLGVPGILAGLPSVAALFLLRYVLYKALGFETSFWWLSPAGWLLLNYIAFASVRRTVTGKNWTWRGRSLSE